MQKKLSAKIKMMKAVDELYDAYKPRFDVLSAMPDTMATFKATRASINVLIPLAEEDTTAMTKQREALREAVSASGALVTKAIVSYADSINDLVLIGEMNWTKSKLMKLTIDKLGPTCTDIFKKAIELRVMAAPFGLTQEKLDSLSTNNAAWISKESATRSKEVAIGEAISRINGLVASNMKLLTKRLDPMVYALSATDAELYGLWVSTRTLEDPGTTKTQLKVSVYNQVDSEPLYGVNLTLSGYGKVIHAKTDVHGEAEFPAPLKQGKYLFTAMLENFKTFQIIEYRLYKGKINRLEVYLEPIVAE